MNPCLVSVICITYNHEKYIRQCLDGFLLQKVDFSFEILIHDDASIDNTADIIREYKAKYPDIIKPIFQTENQYSKKVNILSQFLFPRAKGKYIAMCEGDDYWIDPLKLQKQVDYLEMNPEYGFVHTNYRIFIQDEDRYKPSFSLKIYEGSIYEHLLFGNFISTPTVCFRSGLLSKIDFSEISKQNFIIGDLPLWIELSRLTKFHYLPDDTAVYRVLEKSAMHGSIKHELSIRNDCIRIRKYYLSKFTCGSLLFYRVLFIQYKAVLKIVLSKCLLKIKKINTDNQVTSQFR